MHRKSSLISALLCYSDYLPGTVSPMDQRVAVRWEHWHGKMDVFTAQRAPVQAVSGQSRDAMKQRAPDHHPHLQPQKPAQLSVGLCQDVWGEQQKQRGFGWVQEGLRFGLSWELSREQQRQVEFAQVLGLHRCWLSHLTIEGHGQEPLGIPQGKASPHHHWRVPVCPSLPVWVINRSTHSPSALCPTLNSSTVCAAARSDLSVPQCPPSKLLPTEVSVQNSAVPLARGTWQCPRTSQARSKQAARHLLMQGWRRAGRCSQISRQSGRAALRAPPCAQEC